MKFNFKDIYNINKPSDLYKNKKLKYPINKKLHTNSYLHHIMINLNKIQLLDKVNIPIYLKNLNDMDGIMLAASNQNLEALVYLLKKYPKYLKNTNDIGNNWVHFLEEDGLEKLIFDKNLIFIDWYYILTLQNNDDISTISYIFSSEKKKLINHILKKYVYQKLNINNMKHIFNLFNNYSYSTKEIIVILKKLISNNIKFKNIVSVGLPVHYPLLLRENIEILNILLKYKKNKNEGSYGYIPVSNGSHSLYYLYNSNLNKKYIMNYFKKFKDYLNLSEKTIYNDNILISILTYETNTNFSIKKVNDELFKIHHKDGLLHTISNKKQTILHFLVMIPFKKYQQFHKYIDFKKINIRDKDGNLPIDFTNDKKWIKKLKNIKEYIIKEDKKEDVKLLEKDRSHSTIFKAYIEDIGLYFYFLKEKYPKLYIPNPKIKTLQNNLTYDGIIYPSPFMNIYHEFAWIIIYQDEDTYYLHPYLDLLLKGAINNKKYEYSCLLLSIKNKYGGLHATPIFIDFKKKTVIRWDSYGLSDDVHIIDNIIKTKLADKINFKYTPLVTTQNIVGIQEKARENEIQNIKRGDFGGFCVAWTIWFIEHTIINKQVDTKKLINKLEKLIYKKNSIVNYIRNYSNYLFESIKIIFERNKWDLDNYTNEHMNSYLEEDIIEFIMKNL